MDTPYAFKNKDVAPPKVEVDRNFNPFEQVQPSKGSGKMDYEKQDTSGWENLYVGLNTGTDDDQSSKATYESDSRNADLFEHNTAHNKELGATTYQLHQKYIVSTIKSGMVVIDQHRAHQRILYEELLHTITVKESVSQQLLFPLLFNYSPQELSVFEALRESLENTGFVFGKIEEETLEVIGMPIALSESEIPIVLEQLLSDLENEVPDVGFSQTDMLAKSIAKSTAVKMGAVLNTEEREHMVHRLFACKEPDVSPFNKVIFITVTLDELERQFK